MGKRIPRQLPPVGTKLEAKYRGKMYTAQIVAGETSGQRLVQVISHTFTSLSVAPQRITSHSTNGWRFFGLA